MFEDFPYVNFHDLNLDWLIEKIMSAYSPDNPPPVGMVISVNGETGAVVLYRSPYVTFPPVEDDSWNIHRLANGQSSGIEFVNGQPAMRIDGIYRYKIYDEGNPPPGGGGAVDSVDGMTGVVKTWANSSDPTLNIPEESSGFLWDLRRGLSNGDQIGIEFEYDSVNQVYKTFLKYTPYQGTATRTELLTSASLPPSAGVVSINGQTGVVSLYGDGIAIEAGSPNSIKTVTDGLASRLTSAEGDIDDIAEDLTGVQTSLRNVQTSVSGLQTQVSGMNGNTISIEANSPQSIKQYIDNLPITPGSGRTPVATFTGDGTTPYTTALSYIRSAYMQLSFQEKLNSLIAFNVLSSIFPNTYEIFMPASIGNDNARYTSNYLSTINNVQSAVTRQFGLASYCTYYEAGGQNYSIDKSTDPVPAGVNIVLYK